MSKESPERQNSRFAYPSEEPEIGGVRSVETPQPGQPKRPGGAGPNAGGRQASNGVPGPEERLLDISELTRTVGMRYTHKFRIPPVDGAEEGLTLAGPMEGEITLTNAGASLLLEGEVTAPLSLECSRCLNPTVADVEAEIDEQFDLVTTSNAFRQDVVNAVDDDTPASVIENGYILNLGDLLRQNLLLAAPFQPLCREECPGIDIAGHEGVIYTIEDEVIPEPVEDVHPDNPLRHLAEMMEAKRRQQENTGDSNG